MGKLKPGLFRVGEQAILQAKGKAFHAEQASRFVRLLRPYPRLGKLGWLSLGEINQEYSLPLSESMASVPPICASASSGWAEITIASYLISSSFLV
jgi:hypothetical protein